eukprot:11199931-Lingulodinium_polyedra.AAC.1
MFTLAPGLNGNRGAACAQALPGMTFLKPALQSLPMNLRLAEPGQTKSVCARESATMMMRRCTDDDAEASLSFFSDHLPFDASAHNACQPRQGSGSKIKKKRQVAAARARFEDIE